MSKLDQFFKKKLDDRAFNYEAEAWEGMEDLLDSIPEKKSRRPWWLLLVVVLGIGGLFYVNYGNKSVEITAQEKLAGNDLSGELDRLKITKGETAEINTIEENQQITKKKEIEDTENAIQQVGDNEKKNAITTARIKTNDVITSSSGVETNELQPGNFEDSNSNKKEQKITAPANSSAELKEAKNTINLNQTEQINNELLSDTKSTEILADSDAQSVIDNKATEIPADNEITQTNENSTQEKIERQADIFALLLLKRDEIKSTSEPIEFPKKPAAFYSYKTLRFGILAEHSFLLPFAKNQEVSISNLGPVVQFELNKKWQIQTGLHYRYLKNKVVSVDSVEVNSFGFGLQRTTYHREIDALHYLGWQGLLERRFKLLRIGLGLEIDANLTAFGSLKSKQSTFPWENDQVVPTAEAKGNVRSDFVSRILVTPQLKVSYEVARNTALSLGIKYQLQDYLSADAARTFPIWTEKSLQFKVGLTYYFFNRKKRINER